MESSDISSPLKRFIIIDGNAIVHRAYHALPPLTNAKGEVVNAVYGFFTMLFNLLDDQKPSFLAVAFDRSKPTMRQSLYAGYHQHRPPMASDLAPQMPLISDLLERMNVPIFSVSGYEGDDMLGTLSKQAVEIDKAIEVVIVTGDRDMLQLVDEQTKVLMPLMGLTKTVIFDTKAVEEKYGVSPRQFIDYKALIGDQSDGYPGVAGIGPKTAANLLTTYDTFENLYEQIEKLPEKISSKLAQDAEQAALAKKLATIIRDAPITLHLEECSRERFDIASLRAGFVEHDFNSLVKKLDIKYPQEVKKAPKVIKKKDTVSDGQLGLLD